MTFGGRSTRLMGWPTTVYYRVLRHNGVVDWNVKTSIADEVRIAHAPCRVGSGRNDSVRQVELIARNVELRRGKIDEQLTCGRCRLAHIDTACLNGLAASRIALVGRPGGVSLDEGNPFERELQFLGGDLPERCPHPGAELNLTAEDRHIPIAVDRQP